MQLTGYFKLIFQRGLGSFQHTFVYLSVSGLPRVLSLAATIGGISHIIASQTLFSKFPFGSKTYAQSSHEAAPRFPLGLNARPSLSPGILYCQISTKLIALSKVKVNRSSARNLILDPGAFPKECLKFHHSPRTLSLLINKVSRARGLSELLNKAREKLEEPMNQRNPIKKKVSDAICEAYLAKELMKEDNVRNAAGKAFQAWKDLISALLMLKKDEILKLLKDEDQKKWFLKKGIYAPSSRLKPLSKLLEGVGIADIAPWTDKALDLHTYQYHGPDPEGLWGGPVDKEDAKEDIKMILRKFKEYVMKYFEEYLDEDLREMLERV